MKRTTLAAIVMVAIMALSVCTAVGVTTETKAGAVVPPPKKLTKLTASNSPKYPLRGEQFTISGTLTRSDGKPIANRAITVSWKASDGRAGKLASVKTDSQGRYERGDSAKASPEYVYTVTFAGDTTYAKASTSMRIYVGLSKTSIVWPKFLKNEPLRNQAFTLHGAVKNGAGTSGGTTNADVVKVYRRVSNGQGGWTAWTEYKKTTLSSGEWSTTAYGYTLDIPFKAVYPGNAKLFGSESRPTAVIRGFGVD